MIGELQKSADNLMQMEEKVYKSNKISLELLTQLKNAEVEIETLRSCVVNLRA